MNKIVNKSGVFTALLLASASAMAAGTSSGVFQWTGVAPAAATNDGACIVVASGVNGEVAHDSGVITFHNPSADATTHDIQSSTELAFTVVSATGAACTETQVPFNYQLTNLKVGVNGGQLETQPLATAGAGAWQINHSKSGQAATALSSTAVDAAVNDVIGLTVSGTELGIAAGETVVVQAFVLVNNTATL